MTPTDISCTSRVRKGRDVIRAAALLVFAALFAAPAVAYAEEDPNLDQQLGGLSIAHGERVLDVGHVDMGPKYADGEWTFMIHDDAARADVNTESVWRYPDETVFHVVDQAVLPLPDDPLYSFVGADPGANVWVVPQTQADGVVWLGWNTQDPDVMATIDRGVTLSLTGVQGPGTATVYLQSGSFDEPELLWDSRVEEPQPLWVDVNTHTHANWVFTEPGVYLLQLEASAELVDGDTVSDTQIVRFAVGTATAPEDALTAVWDGADAAPSDEVSEDETAATPEGSEDTEAGAGLIVPILIGAIVVVAVLLIIGFMIAFVRGNRAKHRLIAQRVAAAAEQQSHTVSPAQTPQSAQAEKGEATQ